MHPTIFNLHKLADAGDSICGFPIQTFKTLVDTYQSINYPDSIQSYYLQIGRVDMGYMDIQPQLYVVTIWCEGLYYDTLMLLDNR